MPSVGCNWAIRSGWHFSPVALPLALAPLRVKLRVAGALIVRGRDGVRPAVFLEKARGLDDARILPLGQDDPAGIPARALPDAVQDVGHDSRRPASTSTSAARRYWA